MKKNLFLIILIFFLPALKTFAASVYFSPLPGMNVGEISGVEVMADTEGKSINSVDLIVSYDLNAVSFAGYKENSAGVKLWIKSPYAEDGKVYMTGIIPGGVSGLYDPERSGQGPIPLVELLFRGEKPGTVNFSFEESYLLQNDGKGTYLPHTRGNTEVAIGDRIIHTEDKPSPDSTSPLPFSVTLIESLAFSKTPQMIIFQASDSRSGISAYEIKAGKGEWKAATSPMAISKSIFPYDLTVRAYDYNRNFTDAHLYIPGSIPLWLWMLIILTTISIMWYKSSQRI